MLLLSSDFFKLFFLKNFSGTVLNTIRGSNCLDPDQGQCSVGPDLGPNACKGRQASNVATCTSK